MNQKKFLKRAGIGLAAVAAIWLVLKVSIDLIEPDFDKSIKIVKSNKKPFKLGKQEFKADKLENPAIEFKIKANKPDKIKYIIRPRCDNLILELICDGKKVPKSCVLEGPVVLGCPEDNDPIVDVVFGKDLEKHPRQCLLSNYFNLDSLDLALNKEISCTISATYSTEKIVDPREPGKKVDVCENDEGRILLYKVKQKAVKRNVVLKRSK